MWQDDADNIYNSKSYIKEKSDISELDLEFE